MRLSEMDPEEQFEEFCGKVIYMMTPTSGEVAFGEKSAPVSDIAFVEDVSMFEANTRYERAGLDAQCDFKGFLPEYIDDATDTNVIYKADIKTKKIMFMVFKKGEQSGKVYSGLLKDWEPEEE